MAIHVAILKPKYIRAILDGRKTIESRLTKKERPPFGVAQSGDRLFLKASGGRYLATAVADRVTQYDGLTPERVEGLRQQYQQHVGGDQAYWQSKSGSHFAVFIALRDVEPIEIGPEYPKVNMKAWHVLDDSASPLFDVTLTAGAIRNRYLALGPKRPIASHHPVTLRLPDGRTVRTEVARGTMLRWRGWGTYFKRHHMRPGDRVRFVAVAPRTYRVSFKHAA